jgi:hypothetical protein
MDLFDYVKQKIDVKKAAEPSAEDKLKKIFLNLWKTEKKTRKNSKTFSNLTEKPSEELITVKKFINWLKTSKILKNNFPTENDLLQVLVKNGSYLEATGYSV